MNPSPYQQFTGSPATVESLPESAVRRSPRLLQDAPLLYAPEPMNTIPNDPHPVSQRRSSTRTRRSRPRVENPPSASLGRRASRRAEIPRSPHIEWYDAPPDSPNRIPNEPASTRPIVDASAIEDDAIRPPDATLRSMMLLPPMRGSSVWDAAPMTADEDLERAMEASREAYYNHRMKMKRVLDRQKREVSAQDTLLRTLRTRLSWWNRFSASAFPREGESGSVWETLQGCIDRLLMLPSAEEPLSEEDLQGVRSALDLILTDEAWGANEPLLRFRELMEGLLQND